MLKRCLVILFLFGCEPATNDSGESCQKYDRDSFGYGEVDYDGDGCYARAELLISRSLTPVEMDPKSRCRVAWGKWLDAYSDDTLYNADSVEIDHVVALNEAHQSGAYAWDSAKRKKFSNLDTLDEMVITRSATNNRKSDFDFSDWVPPGSERQKRYAEKLVRIKTHWNLSADPEEVADLRGILGVDAIGLPKIEPEYDCPN